MRDQVLISTCDYDQARQVAIQESPSRRRQTISSKRKSMTIKIKTEELTKWHSFTLQVKLGAKANF